MRPGWICTQKDFTADYAVRIDDNNGNLTNWAGFSFRKSLQSHTLFQSGYTVYMRSNGEVRLYRAGVGEIGQICTSPTPSVYQHFRVQAVGNVIKVYLNGSTTACIDHTDTVAGYPVEGYVHLGTSAAKARFEFLEIY